MRALTVAARTERQAQAQTRAASSGVDGEQGVEPTTGVDEEPWQSVLVELGGEQGALLDAALELAGRVLGGRTALWQRLEALCQEYVGGFAPEAEPKPEAEQAAAADEQESVPQHAAEERSAAARSEAEERAGQPER